MSTSQHSHRVRGALWSASLLLAAAVVLLWTTYSPEPDVVATSDAAPAGPPWRYGPADARFTFELYADFECPYCRQFVPGFLRWVDRQQDVAVEWRHLPLAIHDPAATDQAIIAECAGRRGGHAAFWTTVRTLYQRGRSAAPPSQPQTDMKTCLTNESARTAVHADAQAAAAAGITVTPALRLRDARTGQHVTLYGMADEPALLSALDAVASQ